MMEEKEVEIIKIDGKDFYIVTVIDSYNYLCELTNPNNIIVLKECGEELKSIDDKELDYALTLYYQNTSK